MSPGLKMFNSPVNPLSRSLHRDFVRGHRYPRLCPRSQDHEGISFALPGMGPQRLLPMIRLTEFHPFACHICPDVSETCCGAGEDLTSDDLAECPGVLQVPIQYDDGFIHNFWRLRPDSPGAMAFVATWRGRFFLLSHGASRPDGSKAKSVVRSCFPPGGFICACHS